MRQFSKLLSLLFISEILSAVQEELTVANRILGQTGVDWKPMHHGHLDEGDDGGTAVSCMLGLLSKVHNFVQQWAQRVWEMQRKTEEMSSLQIRFLGHEKQNIGDSNKQPYGYV
jgi:hypothetical protein